MKNKEIEKARSNILRGNDIESACLIMEAVIWDGLVEVGGRVNIIKVAMRQILNFIEEYKNKGYLDVVREKVKANNRVTELESDKQNLIEKLEKDINELINQTKENDLREKANYTLMYLSKYMKILKGESDNEC